MNRVIASLSLTALLAAGASAASAATILPFTPTDPSSAINASSISGTINGVGFTMSALRVSDSLATIGSANVTYLPGEMTFGVDGVGGAANTPGSNPNVAGPNTIDGTGVDSNELLRITFDREVVLNDLEFSFLDPLDDVYVAMGDFAGRFGFGGNTSMNRGGLDGLASLMLTGTVLDIVAGFPNETCTTSATQACGGANDIFALSGADITPTVAPVPLPAGGLLLLSGLLGAGAWGRRRKA